MQPFAINTYGYMTSHSARACLEHLAADGYRAFELMMHPRHLWPPATDGAARRELRRFAEAAGLRLVSLNMPNIDLNLAAATVEMRRHTLGILHGVLELAGDLEVPGVVIGPGKANPLLAEPREELVDRFLRALDELAPHALRVGTALYLENMSLAFLPRADELMDVLDRYGDPRIRIIYDVANAHFVGENPCDGLRRVAPRLSLVHLSDTGQDVYRHSAVGEGTVQFANIPPVLREVGYQDLPMLEIIADDPDAAIRDSVAKLLAMGWPTGP